MIYLWILLAILGGGVIFIGVRAIVMAIQKKERKKKEAKEKKAQKLEFEIGPIILQ